MRRLAPVAFGLLTVFVLAGCSSTTVPDARSSVVPSSSAKQTPSPTPEPVEPVDLKGTWKQNNSSSADGWMTATVTADTITASFVTDGGDMTSLFWVGSFTPPSDDASSYVWTSTRDEAATESALLASTDATKDFAYDDDEISFPVSIAGSTATVRMSRQ